MTWKSQTFRYSITHTFSIGLKLFTVWHTVFWWFWYCFWNFSTRFYKRVLGISKQKKNIWHSLTVSILLVWNNFLKNLLTTKSNESKSVFLTELFWQIIHSSPRGVSREWGWRFTVRMRPTSTWTAPPWKMLRLTVLPHGTEASSSLLRFEPQKSGGMLVLKNRQHEI